MIYLTVPPNPRRWPLYQRTDLGVMLTPRMGMALDRVLLYSAWAADTGCYTQGARFQPAGYLRWLAAMAPTQGRCLFTTAPDVVGNARATWERSRDVLPVLRELGYKGALVAQDGIEDLDIDWSAFDCLFVGGTTRFKLSEAAYGLVAEAKQRGKHAHMGRCNSRVRLIAAQQAGYDSVDGTMVAFGPDRRLPQLLGWLDELRRQPCLDVRGATGWRDFAQRAGKGTRRNHDHEAR